MKELYKPCERWQKTCHSLHLSLSLSALDAHYKPLETLYCIFSLKTPISQEINSRVFTFLLVADFGVV